MPVKTVTLKLADVSQEVAKGVESGVALGLMDTIVNKIKAKVPGPERDGIKVFGLEGVTCQHFHALTPAEEVEEAMAMVAAVNARLIALQALIPETGPLSEEQTDALRAALTPDALGTVLTPAAG